MGDVCTDVQASETKPKQSLASLNKTKPKQTKTHNSLLSQKLGNLFKLAAN